MTSVYIKTFGCSLNQADSEIMAGLLSKAAFNLVETPEQADLVIINSCTVKQPSETRFFHYLSQIEKLSKHIVIAGCIPQATPELVEGYSLVGTSNIGEIVSVVEETLHGNTVTLLAEGECDRLTLPRLRKNPVIAIIPISEGCLGDCSYCIVKRARGKLRSYGPEAIVQHAKEVVRDGAKEVWLTSQDTGCYGKDIGTNLPQLLRALTKLERDFYIRIGMMNPEHVKECLTELVDVYQSDNVFKFIHVPVQSGNDDILKKMGRNYTVSDFVSVVETFRKSIPEVAVSTDVICGFPEETKEQFVDSVNLIQQVKPDVLNISRYWPRPKTRAEEMAMLSGEETKNRSRLLTSQFDWIAFENNKRWRDWEGKILIDERGKENSWIGRNYCYKPVVVKGSYKLGQEVFVKVRGITQHDLRAEEIRR